MALVVVGVAVVVVGALVCGAAATVVSSRAARTEARGLTFVDDSAQAQGWATIRRLPYDGRMLLRVDIDVLSSGLGTPPGVSSWPGPGEMVVSPAAAEALQDDRGLARSLPGTVAGVVGDEGLRTPDELVVYRGVPRDDQDRGGSAVVDRSPGVRADRDTADIPPSQVAGLVGVLVVIAGLPSVAFLSVAARLSAATRARRLAALHLLGAPPRLVRLVNAVEVVVLSVLGWGLGVLVYPAVNAALARSHVLGTTWFAQDTALTIPKALVLLVATLVFAAVVSLRTDIGTGLTQVTVRSARRGRPSMWRLVPLALGVTSLVVQVVLGGRRPDGAVVPRLDLVMEAAVLVTAVGLVVAIPSLVRWVGDLLSAHGPHLAARLGGARASFDPSGAARLVTALALVVLATGVMIGQTRDARAVSVPVTSVVPVTVAASEIPPGSAGALSDAVDAPVMAVVDRPATSPDATSATVVVARCDTLRTYLAAGTSAVEPRSWCADGATYLSVSAQAGGMRAEEVRASVLAAPAGPAGELPAYITDRVIEGGFDALVTVDPVAVIDAVPKGPVENDGATVYQDSVMVAVAATPQTVDAVITGIVSVAPYSQPSAVGLDPDSGAHIAMVNGFIHLGVALAALVTLVALATALTDRATQRRSADVELMLVGVEAGALRSAHRWEVLVTVGAGVAVALVCGVLGGLAWQYAGGLVRDPDWGAIGGLSLATALACAVTVAVATTAVPRSLDLAATRRE